MENIKKTKQKKTRNLRVGYLFIQESQHNICISYKLYFLPLRYLFGTPGPNYLTIPRILASVGKEQT